MRNALALISAVVSLSLLLSCQTPYRDILNYVDSDKPLCISISDDGFDLECAIEIESFSEIVAMVIDEVGNDKYIENKNEHVDSIVIDIFDDLGEDAITVRNLVVMIIGFIGKSNLKSDLADGVEEDLASKINNYLGIGAFDSVLLADLKEDKPEVEPVVPEVEPVVPDVEPVVPDVEPVVPDVEPVVPDVEPDAKPDAEPVVPDAEPVVPDAEPVVPDAEPVVPDAEPVVPDAEPVVPDAEPVSLRILDLSIKDVSDDSVELNADSRVDGYSVEVYVGGSVDFVLKAIDSYKEPFDVMDVILSSDDSKIDLRLVNDGVFSFTLSFIDEGIIKISVKSGEIKSNSVSIFVRLVEPVVSDPIVPETKTHTHDDILKHSHDDYIDHTHEYEPHKGEIHSVEDHHDEDKHTGVDKTHTHVSKTHSHDDYVRHTHDGITHEGESHAGNHYDDMDHTNVDKEMIPPEPVVPPVVLKTLDLSIDVSDSGADVSVSVDGYSVEVYVGGSVDFVLKATGSDNKPFDVTDVVLSSNDSEIDQWKSVVDGVDDVYNFTLAFNNHGKITMFVESGKVESNLVTITVKPVKTDYALRYIFANVTENTFFDDIEVLEINVNGDSDYKDYGLSIHSDKDKDEYGNEILTNRKVVLWVYNVPDTEKTPKVDETKVVVRVKDELYTNRDGSPVVIDDITYVVIDDITYVVIDDITKFKKTSDSTWNSVE